MSRKLHIWSGGVKITTIESTPLKPIVQNAETKESKFDTCISRSPEEITRTKKTCCRSKSKTGFLCLKRDIFPLTKNVCEQCDLYQAK